jgi:hypothetical protein
MGTARVLRGNGKCKTARNGYVGHKKAPAERLRQGRKEGAAGGKLETNSSYDQLSGAVEFLFVAVLTNAFEGVRFNRLCAPAVETKTQAIFLKLFKKLDGWH